MTSGDVCRVRFEYENFGSQVCFGADQLLAPPTAVPTSLGHGGH